MNALVVSGFNAPAVSVDPAAIERRDALIAESKTIRAIESDFGFELAASTLQDLKGLTKAAEDSREQIKRPVITLGRAIDAEAKTFVAPIDPEISRISLLVAGYTEEQRRIAAEAEKKRLAEIQRIEQERIAAEAAAKAQADAELAKAKTPEDADAVVVRQEAAQETIARAAAERSAEVIFAPQPVVPKVKGVTVAPVWRFEVLDVSALHQARPELVELSPRASAINSAIRDGAREIPGLRIWQESRVGVRS